MHGGLDNANGKYAYIQNRGDDSGSGISIFDPVLCELAYRWFSAKDSIVLDPFAGGSVRGIIASKIGRQYVGIELRKEQVDANVIQGQQICDDPQPIWKCGDSADLDLILGDDFKADFVFSCPPYADLEVYSDDPRDISNMAYPKFLELYELIIKKAINKLNDDRFACFVVGEVRDKKTGKYKNFVPDTINAFIKAGADYYNEAILVTAIGSLPIRAGRQFNAGRKLGKTHQNVLVFVKGNPKKATEYCGEIEVHFPEEELAQDTNSRISL